MDTAASLTRETADGRCKPGAVATSDVSDAVTAAEVSDPVSPSNVLSDQAVLGATCNVHKNVTAAM